MAHCPQSVTFLVPEAAPTATYTITFQGVTVQNSNSTWCYSVSVTGNPGLSHWVLGVFELCQELLEKKLLSVTRNGVKLEENIGYELGIFDGVFGVKFEVGAKAEESPVEYCITLDGIYKRTAVDVAVKGGPTPAQKIEDALCGPSCEEIDPREFVFGNLLETIALEETALAHLINAEAEKIQWSIGTLEGQEPTENNTNGVLAIHEAVKGVMRLAIKFQMLLQFKLENIVKLDEGESQ